MSNNILKFPYDACRRVHSMKPRRSKNGTPEERAAKAAALLPSSPADVVPMSHARAQARSDVDGRKLRGSPLRDYIGVISFGATVVGKMHTAGLRGERLAEVEPGTRKEWLETLDQAEDALISVAIGFEKAMNALRALDPEFPDPPDELPVHDLGQPVLSLVTERDQ